MTVSEASKRLPFANVCGFAILTLKFCTLAMAMSNVRGLGARHPPNRWQMALQMLTVADRVLVDNPGNKNWVAHAARLLTFPTGLAFRGRGYKKIL
jgi:hypothetical protein